MTEILHLAVQGKSRRASHEDLQGHDRLPRYRSHEIMTESKFNLNG
ncbi:hypothetical protein [Sphingobium yanoikuyae]|nr:hypothetical protein [Sphingobium yanoikuyae]WBQ19281.1 hypothetical protein PAE53_23080 [Sphingobium yanoikuyae]